MGEFSVTHLLLLGLIFLVFFGPSRLPQLGSSLGKAIRGFKQGLNEIDVDPKDIKDTHQQVQHQQQNQQVHQTQSQKETHNS
ncbi:twin-arginine translocase TatA/TatE family subunit [Bdellovibrio sp. HCB274]|uniref:twin-arginine translocase TatA/TatE family subunit n=1 Tax=Bdellovibrio sp. HCB274 TaxID=3394361 RepID=UPI0039B5B31E